MLTSACACVLPGVLGSHAVSGGRRDRGQPGCEHPEGPGCPRNAPGALSAPGRCFVLGSVCSGRAARSPDALLRQEFLVITRA